MGDMDKYSKLVGSVDYDREAAEQLAEALNEIAELERRVAALKSVVDENEELHQFVWRTAEGKSVALHNIGNDHLGNIMLHLLRTNRAIPKAIRGEAVKRELVIPQIVDVWDEDSVKALQADRMDVGRGF